MKCGAQTSCLRVEVMTLKKTFYLNSNEISRYVFATLCSTKMSAFHYKDLFYLNHVYSVKLYVKCKYWSRIKYKNIV